MIPQAAVKNGGQRHLHGTVHSIKTVYKLEAISWRLKIIVAG